MRRLRQGAELLSTVLWRLLDKWRDTERTQPASMAVRAAGMCCAVGTTLPAAVCAIEAGMDHFQESEFRCNDGSPLLVGRLPELELWGQERLARWTAAAIAECWAQAPELDWIDIPTLWLAPEPDRAGCSTEWCMQAYQQALDLLGHRPRSAGIMALGRAGLAQGLAHAAQCFSVDPNCRHVLLIGADSLLNAATINHYLLDERLHEPGVPDGFIPGEAAAAVLLELRPKQTPGLHILGYAQAIEPGRIDGSVPSRSQGLTHAIRQALSPAGITFADLCFRFSDQNGESFYARDAANAVTRLLSQGAKPPALLTLADSLGEVGSATGVAMLAVLSRLLPRWDNPHQHGLVHLANDDGIRSAVVLNHSVAQEPVL